MNDLLHELLHELDSNQGRHAYLQRYATGTQPLAYLTAEQRKALDNQLVRLAVNIPALAVSAICERLRVSGFSDPRAWDMFVDTQLDQLAPDAMSDALTYGTGYVLVWAKDGRPTATVESPCECAVLRDPADRSVIAGVKRFSTKDATEAFVYLPNEVQHWRAPRTGAAINGFVHIDTVEHHLDAVPLVPIDNGRSEIEDLTGLTDALTKTILDQTLASHVAGFGQRWVAGVAMVERPRLDEDGNPVLDDHGAPVIDTVSPFKDTVGWAIAQQPESKFGNFDEPTLAGFHTAVRTLTSMIQAVSALPSHYLGTLTNQPTSADALRAAEASLTARAEQRQLRFGRAIETVGKLLLAIESGRSPADFPLRVRWAPADTRSQAQEADRIVKLVQSGILPVSYALADLGYSADEIARIQAARAAENHPTTENSAQSGAERSR
ncbi:MULTISPECIES: phage portal protein [unclassified Mycolicibacterium]|uniref:phage portal protein n=1 Tax=unclassified Mycolicibacterium TaxID=2636767 RepID=UPI0012DCE156|nr:MULTISPECIES: phage portal protein [unclassified Mycolicibacterium]MUL80511.1 phage portal protein [Mycolicibacterium sp. CBMA 329]MUL86278.1 phage portal protein [Mycolicibacterium sp. CBMA 331]MUM01060.1 phage portal protein [Mycolicibacterium sp. CBMA 334]MUM24954.1 phage portal protein [Mycolicibacterium sp. CBMA 295]MUM36574.1 phage portal protein [Mycolicibacterium sp. CBMA 247]